MEDNKLMKIGYEQTDNKIEIEIYGIKFEIKNLDNDKVEKLKNIDKNLSVIDEEIENILGEGAVEKINNQRIKDGYEKMDINVALNILSFCFMTYAKSMANNVVENMSKTINEVNNDMEKFENRINRSQRRNNNYRGNYRRNYRKY